MHTFERINHDAILKPNIVEPAWAILGLIRNTTGGYGEWKVSICIMRVPLQPIIMAGSWEYLIES